MLQSQHAQTCDACEAQIEGEAAGHGLFIHMRGDNVVYEEPPLCRKCALAIGVTALAHFYDQDEGG